ncbi:tRNA (N(6)-L-threonylcarbamoyladenosine(37)-C(2))-methylthiotransferase MtaB [Phreatobacter oligotrophus]|jgi:threonylcarbamoyladenosine tRNA methylthiotransferase MtaB|uniref:tRNA (N(6)-L-threonylcarbamoyladenosine(37)-C(2))- methylthiotransferase MtaB n=1 Tax=Phreatobacter oligotrophus TaxID=1122261 RepID=UPI002355C41E|nr:tRNA (N(6)-L-threonylcarbamoyladenosine(37)-C(2))-methylthiotransferase MtaB [Phreatobacter oligotrophus]MBX9989455.1 tRNA (N(6)-L-threonylcarbamoyladenosine(37)-C(2))-methylthiotransferase MtaB [Phreatobacter oligotrophus]
MSAARPSVEVVTFGCRLNTSESEVMQRLAAEAGLSDAIVVNTCAVTGEATRQARQAIRRLKRENPAARIIVTGCAAQTEPEVFAEMAEVDRVIGNDEKMKAEVWGETRRALSQGPDFGIASSEKVAVNDIMAVREQALHLVDGLTGRSRAFVQVQNGCDHRCTFCIIPFGRGNSRSVPMGEVVAQVRKLVENGYREVVLTGVDITSYGQGLPGEPKLGALVRAILRHVPELERLRISSIDSVEADPDLMAVIAEEERFMPHLHLSLQAGDDMVLKRMKRRHLRDDAIRFCAEVRRLRPDMVFGADIIAGFPTETEEMFARSLAIVDECGLTHLHVFPFSPRPGTPAARMPQVARDVVKERAKRLRAKGEAALAAHLDAMVGRTFSVLAETDRVARTGHFTPVRLARDVAPGSILTVMVSGHDGREALAA